VQDGFPLCEEAVGMTTTPQTLHRIDHSSWPALFSDDPHALRRFLTARGFEVRIVVPAPSSTQSNRAVMPSDLLGREGCRTIDASVSNDHHTPRRPDLYVVTDYPDEVHAKAVTLGAEITRPLAEQSGHGSREFSLQDPDGNGWSFGTYGG